MPQYTQTVTATTNATAGTEDAFVQIGAAAGSSCRIKRVAISLDTASSDARLKIILRRNSTAGAGGVAGTIVRKDGTTRASSAASIVKTGATAFTNGTAVDIPAVRNINGRATFEWIPRNYMEEISVQGGQFFTVGVVSSVASLNATVDAEWED